MLIGDEAIKVLAEAKVAVFGVGGVGGMALTALARSGVGNLVTVDADEVEESNINRQLVACVSTLGRSKVKVAGELVRDVNPDVNLQLKNVFFLPETANEFEFADYDYVIDAVDTMSAKLELVRQCKETGTPIISSMGMGNRMDPSKVGVYDIYETVNCPLAKRMRKELRKMGIADLKVVASTEKARMPFESLSQIDDLGEWEEKAIKIHKKIPPASMMIVPAVAGLFLANEVIRDLITKK